MADQAFFFAITESEGTSNPGEVTIRYQVAFCKNDHSGATVVSTCASHLGFKGTMAAMRDTIVEDIKAKGASLGYDLSGENTVVMPQFLKV